MIEKPLDIKVKTEEQAEKFPALPKDIYQVQLLDITVQTLPSWDTRHNPPETQVLQDKLSFQFTLLEGKDGDKDLRGRNVWANFVPTYLATSEKFGKNKLWRIVEAIKGRTLTDEDKKNLGQEYLNGLIGNQLRISVEPKEKGDKTYDNITDFLKASKDLEPLTEEEKDKARVKSKGKPLAVEEELNVEDIPF